MAGTSAQRAVRRPGLDLAGRRALVCAAAAGGGLAAAISAGASWSVAVLAAWDGAAVAFLVLVWPVIATRDAVATAALARDEDASHPASEAVLVSASAASLVSVAFTLAQAGHEQHAARVALTVGALASVALAWACVHTVYTLRYARLYYTQPVGGLGFAEADPPEYLDFAYVSLTIGMCFQVSDTDISKRTLRRTATHHALLSYLFGAVILAIAVSSVASLIGR